MGEIFKYFEIFGIFKEYLKVNYSIVCTCAEESIIAVRNLKFGLGTNVYTRGYDSAVHFSDSENR